jgi:AraC-like DNA-binding protein
MFDRNAEFREGDSDVVSELLMGMRLRGASYGKLRLSPPCGVSFAGTDDARFHFVAAGNLHLESGKGETIALGCGDAVLLPRGDAHALVSAPGVRPKAAESFDTMPLCSNICAVTATADGSCRTKDVLVFTGRMEFELDTLHPLVGLMPKVMSVGSLMGRQPEIVPLLEAMEREMAAERAGTAGILARLADVVAATIVRGWVECGCGEASGWIEALRDPRLGRVIAALHRDPSRDWTVAEMAARMGSSRSVFAERFATVTGTTPLRYLAALRMRLAAQWLTRDRMPIDAVARRLGYASQAAFSRAYKRIMGQPPGRARSSPPKRPNGSNVGI